MTEYDANEVLQQYAALLADTEKGLFRDVSELPFPKDVIKGVLQECLAMDVDEETLEMLKTAYIALSNFQELSEAERKAIEVMHTLEEPASAEEDLPEQAQRLASAMEAYGAVIARSQSELDTLVSELKGGAG